MILTFLKSNYKLTAFVFLVIVIIILWFRFQSEKHRADQAEEGRDAAVKISNGQSSKRYKNKQGDTVIVTQVIGIPKSQVDALLKEKELQWLKKFEGKGNIQSAESFSTEFNLESIPEKIKYLPCKDSLKVTEFSIHDQWNNIHAMVVDTPTVSVSDRYYGVIKLKRPKGWFWKFQWSKREPISEITNSNKLIRIDSVSVITIIR